MPEISNRKARRIQRVRGQIMDAAVEIIAEKGFTNTTTKAIAAKADMAEGTLYNYFKNKDDILLGIAERYISYKRNFDVSTDVASMEEFMINMYATRNQFDPEAHVQERTVLRALLPEFLTDRVLGKMYYERIVQPFLTTMEEKLTVLQERGLIKSYEVTALSRLVYSSLIGFAILDINGDELTSNPTPEFRQEVGRAYIDVLSDGMTKK